VAFLRLILCVLILPACSLDPGALPGDGGGVMDSAADGADPMDTTPPSDTGGPGDSTTPTDTGGPDADDAGGALTNFYDVTWGPGVPVRELHDMDSCETDPVLTPDERWLFISRPDRGLTRAGCYADRRFFVYEWNDGAPELVAKLQLFDSGAGEESNAHPLDGGLFGRPGSTLMIYVAGPMTGSRRLAFGWLSAAPSGAPIVRGAWGYLGISGYAPSLTNDGTRLTYGVVDDLYESVGLAPDGFGVGTRVLPGGRGESDAALSPDGRLLVLGRPDDDPLRLYVVRRREVDEAFGADELLPDTINLPGGGTDPFITTSGDLLYTTADGAGAQRVYIARRIAP